MCLVLSLAVTVCSITNLATKMMQKGFPNVRSAWRFLIGHNLVPYFCLPHECLNCQYEGIFGFQNSISQACKIERQWKCWDRLQRLANLCPLSSNEGIDK